MWGVQRRSTLFLEFGWATRALDKFGQLLGCFIPEFGLLNQNQRRSGQEVRFSTFHLITLLRSAGGDVSSQPEGAQWWMWPPLWEWRVPATYLHACTAFDEIARNGDQPQTLCAAWPRSTPGWGRSIHIHIWPAAGGGMLGAMRPCPPLTQPPDPEWKKKTTACQKLQKKNNDNWGKKRVPCVER